MPHGDETRPETPMQPLEEPAESAPENTQIAPPTPQPQDLVQDQLLAIIAERRRQEAASRKHPSNIAERLGKLVFWRREKPPREPQPGDISRRRMIDRSIRRTVGLGLGLEGAAWLIEHHDEVGQFVGHKIHQGGEVGKLLTFQQEFDAKMAGLPSDADIKRGIPNLGRKLDLAEWRERRGVKGPVNVFIINVGTSNSFAFGTDDLNHPREQKHAAVYRAAEALKSAARRMLGIGDIKTLVLARPGAYSGEQFPGITDEDQPRDGILTQLEDLRIQEFIDEAGPDDIIIFRYEGGFDDLRLLADDIDHIERTLGRLEEALDSDEPITDEIKAELAVYEAKLNNIAAGYNQNFQRAAARIAQYNQERIAKFRRAQVAAQGEEPPRPDPQMVFQPVWTWSLFEQARVPFGLLKRQDNSAPMPVWLKPDLTDYNPHIPRFFIELDAIREGNKLARWAWVKLCLAQNEGLNQAMLDHPELEVVPESLIGVNLEDDFYAALVEGEVDDKGDGHPGLIPNRPGHISGIDRIAMRILRLWQHHFDDLGDASADDFADFDGRSPRLAA